jgi:hypothetical protein
MKNKLQKCRFSNLKSITAKVFLMFAVFNASQQLFAQFTDDFSDGDFVYDPRWSGHDSKFVIEASKLSLKAPPVTDIAYLATTSRSINDATWEFLVHLEFNPSTSNYARVYLVSDQPNLSGALNGYFIEIGNITDDVSLYRQTGLAITRLIDGGDGKTDLAAVILSVKVHRDYNGLWTLYSDAGATGTYVTEGSILDKEHVVASFFGVFCSYTSTRSDKFHFDNFSVTGEVLSDPIPPELINVEILPSQLRLTFSEDIEPETAVNLNNYHVDGIGHPINSSLKASNVVELTFEKDFADQVSYVLNVVGIRDKNGNLINATEKILEVARPVPVVFKDIILTEIYPDPSPVIGMPDVEFIEIYNRSENTASLDQWSLSDGSSTMTLPETVIGPGEYIILTSDTSLFPAIIKSIGSSDFPSLNNSDDNLRLTDASGKTVDSVHYSMHWYRDDQKNDGGWSLELIDPDNTCAEAENWMASEDSSGGTPGMQNSVFASNPDLTGPVLRAGVAVSPVSIRLIFNEKLQQEVPSPDLVVIEPDIGVKSISIIGRSHSEMLLELTTELSTGVLYGLTVRSIADCAGNWISEPFNHVSFGLPEKALSSDLLINEILFDPRPGGVDFVEIVNVSEKFFNLKNWTIGNFENDTVTRALLISSDDLLLPPGGYLALTEDIDVLIGEYPSASEPNIFEVDKLPSFNDDEGSVAVLSEDGVLLDFLIYSKSLHSVFINDPEGVSLERIALTTSNDIQNWKSASTASGYATPGYLNSNSRSDPTPMKSITVEPEAFIPVYGQPDFAMIYYEFDHGGYIANVKVMDAHGHPVKQLAEGEILGTKGAYRWDGDRDDGTKARVGYYMVWFEVFYDTGEVKTFFSRVVVATRF